ncbi:major facilitator superfamily MFS_1 [Acetobacter malorum]|nr:major facilitator superfamily MFS_1 [Acetobacter malorum]
MSDVFLEPATADIGSMGDAEPTAPAWMAVFSLTMGVFGLLTAEYLPASLLTPMAAGLGVSEALAGQAVTVTAVVAMFSGLLTASLTRRIDRRIVLFAFSLLMIASNLLAALSSSLVVLLAMRVLLGIALGGFWSMAAAVAMRLVPASLLPRALSIIFSGIAVATVVAVPLGSYLGALYGWRAAFLTAAALGVLTLAFQFFSHTPFPRYDVPYQKTLSLWAISGVSHQPGSLVWPRQHSHCVITHGDIPHWFPSFVLNKSEKPVEAALLAMAMRRRARSPVPLSKVETRLTV